MEILRLKSTITEMKYLTEELNRTKTDRNKGKHR